MLSRLKPSLADILFVTLMVWAFMTEMATWESLLRDGDTGFHIRIGDWIRSHGAVPSQHPFAFAIKKEWYAFEWLAQLLMSVAHSAAGLKGVVLGAGVLIASSAALLFRSMLWRGANPLLSLVLVLFLFNVNRVHFLARPHLITWLLLAVSLWILDRDRRAPSRWVFALVPIAAFWANMHGGFFLFIVLLGLHTAALAAEAIFDPAVRSGRMREARRAALITSLCAAATLLNPYAHKLHLHIFEFLRADWIVSNVEEFQSPRFREEPAMLFMALLFLALAFIPSLLAKRKWTEAVWVLFLGYSALVSVRHMTMFTLVIGPILAVELTTHWQALVARSSRKDLPYILNDAAEAFGSGAARLSVWPIVFVAWLAWSPSVQWPADFPKKEFPVELARRQGTALAGTRVLTSDQWSDYLIYLNYPRQISFIDPQTQYYGQLHAQDYVAIMRAHPGSPRLIDRFDFDYALLDEGAAAVSVLRNQPNWTQIDKGGGAILFKRGG